MSKYQKLWAHVSSSQEKECVLSFVEIQEITGFAIDHSFLTCKKELMEYGWEVAKVFLKDLKVRFRKTTK